MKQHDEAPVPRGRAGATKMAGCGRPLLQGHVAPRRRCCVAPAGVCEGEGTAAAEGAACGPAALPRYGVAAPCGAAPCCQRRVQVQRSGYGGVAAGRGRRSGGGRGVRVAGGGVRDWRIEREASGVSRLMETDSKPNQSTAATAPDRSRPQDSPAHFHLNHAGPNNKPRPCSLPHPNPKYFLLHPSHQIFRRMHEALNVGKKDN
jgi:hypothetical protein